MTKRPAQTADADEELAFGKIRRRFILEVAEHMDAGNGIAGATEHPDQLFMTLMELAVLAQREGKPQPFPWFVAFCERLLDEQNGTREPTPDPIVN